MIDYFVESDYTVAKKKADLLFGLYFLYLGLYLLFCGGMVYWFSTLPFRSPTMALVKGVHYSITILFIAFSFIYFGVWFKRVNRYKKLCYNLYSGKKEENTAKFLRVDENLHDKDGVLCKALIFSEWNKYKKEFYERKVLLFAEKPIPKIEKDDKVFFKTQGNVLYSYEILTEEKEKL